MIKEKRGKKDKSVIIIGSNGGDKLKDIENGYEYIILRNYFNLFRVFRIEWRNFWK